MGYISSMLLCAIEGCGKPARGHDWCSKHYTRWRRHGDPLADVGRPRPLAERFWAKVKKGEGCWLWQGRRNPPLGYGQLRIGPEGNQRSQAAHRIAWMLTNGPIPAGLCICHRCDNPPCVRPDHLFLGTYSDNSLDSVRKGRAKQQHGESNLNAKLTQKWVTIIRERYAAEADLRINDLAQQLGVSNATISHVLRGKTWAKQSSLDGLQEAINKKLRPDPRFNYPLRPNVSARALRFRQQRLQQLRKQSETSTGEPTKLIASDNPPR